MNKHMITHTWKLFIVFIVCILISGLVHTNLACQTQTGKNNKPDKQPELRTGSNENDSVQDNTKLIIITIENEKTMVNGREYDLKSLKQLIKTEAAAAGWEKIKNLKMSRLRLRIRADFECRTKKIQEIFDICQEYGVYKTEITARKNQKPTGCPDY
jgi:biopolymer transport protein ExbD